MTPAKLTTRGADPAYARARRKVAEKYLEVAGVVDDEDGAAINVCVGLAVLAGIAASDALCAVSLGERYSGTDHAAAVTLLKRVDPKLSTKLKTLVDLKPGAHYGNELLSSRQRQTALRAAATLVDEARTRTT